MYKKVIKHSFFSKKKKLIILKLKNINIWDFVYLYFSKIIFIILSFTMNKKKIEDKKIYIYIVISYYWSLLLCKEFPNYIL